MRRAVVLCASVSLVALALVPGAVSGQSPSAATGQSPSGGWDPQAITGTVKVASFQSSPAETQALTATLDGFKAAYPNITVDYAPIPGDYGAAMSANFAAHDVPDL